MMLIPTLLKELDEEAHTTRKMLGRVPTGQFDWQPHPKSMKMKELATHIADLPSWILLALTTDELDFATTEYNPEDVADTDQLLDFFERQLASGRSELEKAREAQLAEPWILRSGETIHWRATRGEMIRHAYSQMIHHRAQLGVYLRLLNIPIPGSYGPSADEQNF